MRRAPRTTSAFGIVIAAWAASMPANAAAPVISSISQVIAEQTQTITIQGTGFGTMPGYTGDSPYISVLDCLSSKKCKQAGVWQAGYIGGNTDDGVTLIVNSWTNTQIVLGGFSGQYGGNGGLWVLHDGDLVGVSLWNAQTLKHSKKSTCFATVGGSAASC